MSAVSTEDRIPRIPNREQKSLSVSCLAVLNFPESNLLKAVQSFLGLSGYFRKFIEFYAIKAKPLYP